MEIEIPKSVMIYIMPSFDCFVAGLFFYMALKLTNDWGLGNRRHVLLFIHRLLMFGGSMAFAYHSFDIYQDPIRHGLTFSNFLLHLLLVLLAIVSSWRIMVAEKHYGNGGAFTGPFGRRPR